MTYRAKAFNELTKIKEKASLIYVISSSDFQTFSTVEKKFSLYLPHELLMSFGISNKVVVKTPKTESEEYLKTSFCH